MTPVLNAPWLRERANERSRDRGAGASDRDAILRRYPRTVAVRRAGGLVSLLIGLVSLVAWSTGHGGSTSLSPEWSPIQPNAAICLVLLGVALQLSPTLRAGVLSAVAGLIAAITGVEYLFHWTSGIDNLVFTSDYGVPPGRMAPNTALAIALAAAVLSARGLRQSHPHLLSSGGSILSGLGVVAVAGYTTDLRGAYLWGNVTAMALGTAVALLAVGLSTLAAARLSIFLRDPNAARGDWLPVPLGVAALTVAVVLWQAVVSAGDPTISVRTTSGVFITLVALITSGLVAALLARQTAVRAQGAAEKAELALAAAALELENRAVLLEESLGQLRRSNRELEEFAYVASHDLQEPLRIVAGYVQLLERRYKGQLDDDADEFIGFVVDGANRMKNLIQDLLTYSRLASGGNAFAAIDLQAVVARSLATLSPALEQSDGTVEVGALPIVPGDAIQLEQLFTNLLGNALKFAAPGRPLSVTVTSRRVDDGWEVSVADNGIGIPPQHRDRVFRMFQRLHGVDDYPGTGIGLAIAQRIVARHGGEICVADSAKDRGTTISFTLLEVPPVDTRTSSEPGPPRNQETPA